MVLYKLHEITGGYQNKDVLFDINLEIDQGDFVSIIGPNGAGKSTLLKVLTGDIVPDSGKVFFSGDLGSYNTPLLCNSDLPDSCDLLVLNQLMAIDYMKDAPIGYKALAEGGKYLFWRFL